MRTSTQTDVEQDSPPGCWLYRCVEEEETEEEEEEEDER